MRIMSRTVKHCLSMMPADPIVAASLNRFIPSNVPIATGRAPEKTRTSTAKPLNRPAWAIDPSNSDAIAGAANRMNAAIGIVNRRVTRSDW